MLKRSYNLSTDLYELTMAAAYFENQIRHPATFELFVRRLPPERNYLIAAGLEQVLDYLESLRFTDAEVEYVRSHPSFAHVSREFFDYLKSLRFTGEVWAMPEGTAVFANEPLLRVTAPVIEAQIIETFLLTTINLQTLIASKAARVVTAAAGRSVIEFGTRRAHGSEAGLLAARAAYIGGCIGTSNVEAGFLFGIPTFGTLAHSFVMLFDQEDDAFRAFLKVFPESATILVDTYDTLAATERLANNFEQPIQAIRLDSGDLASLSKAARKILDDAGRASTKIFASSDLDEYRIAELLREGAQIDAFGVGTQLATSYDAPALSCVYKLVEVIREGKAMHRIKLSKDKATYPGAKQVWRQISDDEKYQQDVIAFADEAAPLATEGNRWQPLLQCVMQSGKRAGDFAPTDSVESSPSLARSRELAQSELRRLPDELLALDSSARYAVNVSEKLRSEQKRLQELAEARIHAEQPQSS